LVAYGPTLLVHIGFDPTFRPVQPAQRPNVPKQDFFALVDTGATECCIDSALADQLGLPVVDRQSISGVSGTRPVNLHLAHIYVPSLNFTMWGRFAGVELQAGGQPHLALIGRTFLAHFTMIYDGTTGDVTLLY
jgi:predicted aspartyl protease